VLALIATVALAHPDPGMPPRTSHVGERHALTVAARDGTELHTVWLIPKGDGPFPTIVSRSPYPMGALLDFQCRMFVRRGYACAYQEVRGRGRSEGEWSPFTNEERDGEDMLTWIRAQPWSDHRVAWLGDSYLAATGWEVASEDPDDVITLVSRIFAPSLYTSAYEDGLLRHELVTAWMAIMPDSRNRFFAAGAYHRALKHRPRTDLDLIAAGHPVAWYREWLTGEDPTGPLWRAGDPYRFEHAPENTSIPVLMVGGWSDAFVEAQLDAWATLGSRDQSALVIGPWAHLGQKPSAVQLRHVGGPGGGDGLGLQLPRVMDWLDVHVQGAAPRYPQTGVVTYVIGGDRWETRPDWPPPTRDRTFGIVAGDDRCDGALADGPQPAVSLEYTYDPEHPLPSRGGAGLLAGAVPLMHGVKPGFVRSPDHCRHRDDVLRFTSQPLDAKLHLAGTVRVELDVASDVPDTAFGFRLLEDRPHGPTILLREGFTTLALRDGGPKKAYHPGDTVHVVADGAPLEAEVHAGSRLVLVITSSSFPAYEAHPNVDGQLSAATDTAIAHQLVVGATVVIPEVVE
jgi:putative CocE/NonD family hydrolase